MYEEMYTQSDPGTSGGRQTLTSRESEILALVARGLSNSQVADRFDVTVHAVKFHLASIYRKLHVANRTEAAAWFFEDPLANGGRRSAGG
jgi:DNA-binding NarL/FixJ family response regulator